MARAGSPCKGYPMGNDINISSKGERTSGAKSAEQERRLDQIREKQAADRKAANDAKAARQAADDAARKERQAAKEAAEAEAAKAKQRKEAQGEVLNAVGAAALSAGGAAIGELGKSAKQGQLKITGKTLFFGVAVLAIIALLLFLAWPRICAMLVPEPETTVATELDEEQVMGVTTAEINGVILGEARQKQELVVWEQDVQVESEISQALANLNVFKKTKTVKSFGTGVYTVDMGQITEESIAVDEAAHTVTMSIPHTKLQYITKDLEKTEFETTQHSILGFGDVKLTQEQQNVLERSIEDAMRTELETDECFADADEAALLVVYDVYQPLINKVDDTYTLEVRFAD